MGQPGDAMDELRECVRRAASTRTTLRLRGAGTKDFYGEHLEGEIVDLKALCGVVHYEPSELVLCARGGTPLSQLEALLRSEGQFLPFEPPRPGADPTLGGVIAAGLSGPRRMYAGAARDFVLGTRLMDGRGELLHFGGEVMKNVAGFDVSRLLCGSLGILGILTEVSLKVLPRPRSELTVRLELPAAAAVGAFNRWAGQPLPLAGAAWSGGAAWVRLAGAAPAVAAAAMHIGGERVDETTAGAFWEDLRDLALPIFASSCLWRVSLPSTAAVDEADARGLIDWGGAVRWHGDPSADLDPSARAAALGGSATKWRDPHRPGTRFAQVPPATLNLHRRLKERFDPHGIFNRGRLIPGL